jgi:hypothetical protein
VSLILHLTNVGIVRLNRCGTTRSIQCEVHAEPLLAMWLKQRTSLWAANCGRTNTGSEDVWACASQKEADWGSSASPLSVNETKALLEFSLGLTCCIAIPAERHQSMISQHRPGYKLRYCLSMSLGLRHYPHSLNPQCSYSSGHIPESAVALVGASAVVRQVLPLER